MTEWITESLAHIVGGDVAEDLAKYIMSIDDISDFEDYLGNILNLKDEEQRNFYENIFSAKFGDQSLNNLTPKTQPKEQASPKAKGHTVTKSKQQSFNQSKKESVKSSAKSGIGESKRNSNKTTPLYKSYEKEYDKSSTTAEGKGKKQKKFVKLNINQLQKAVLKKGRHKCECQATEHDLINNCLDCGRIVCAQEGSGPCLFCGAVVLTSEEIYNYENINNQKDPLINAYLKNRKFPGWNEAEELKDRMLEYDRTSTQRTKVIDDQADYYSLAYDTWATPEEREDAQKQIDERVERASRSRLDKRTFTLDLGQIKAVEENPFEEEIFKCKNVDEVERVKIRRVEKEIEDSLKLISIEPCELKTEVFGVMDEVPRELEPARAIPVVQDGRIMDTYDTGMCLSMHQPWASLLVYGIKKHEGRKWYTPHRGTLWIAATGKPVEPADIKMCEQFYMKYYEGKTINFPTDYPSGCLLGRVIVEDCLVQSEYQDMYPDGESDSPFVLICSQPEALPITYSMKGEHKIYKLPVQMRKKALAALNSLKRYKT